MPDQVHKEETVKKDGYEFTFYPGFASRCTVRDADGTEYELYKQSKPHNLPPGQTRPDNKHKLRLKGGKRKQDITLDIHDPALRIARITIELYGEGDELRSYTTERATEAVTIMNTATTCPPNCDE